MSNEGAKNTANNQSGAKTISKKAAATPDQRAVEGISQIAEYVQELESRSGEGVKETQLYTKVEEATPQYQHNESDNKTLNSDKKHLMAQKRNMNQLSTESFKQYQNRMLETGVIVEDRVEYRSKKRQSSKTSPNLDT